MNCCKPNLENTSSKEKKSAVSLTFRCLLVNSLSDIGSPCHTFCGLHNKDSTGSSEFDVLTFTDLDVVFQAIFSSGKWRLIKAFWVIAGHFVCFLVALLVAYLATEKH